MRHRFLDSGGAFSRARRLARLGARPPTCTLSRSWRIEEVCGPSPFDRSGFAPAATPDAHVADRRAGTCSRDRGRARGLGRAAEAMRSPPAHRLLLGRLRRRCRTRGLPSWATLGIEVIGLPLCCSQSRTSAPAPKGVNQSAPSHHWSPFIADERYPQVVTSKRPDMADFRHPSEQCGDDVPRRLCQIRRLEDAGLPLVERVAPSSMAGKFSFPMRTIAIGLKSSRRLQ